MAREVFAGRPGIRRAVWFTARILAMRLPMDAVRALAWMVGAALWLVDSRGRRTVAANLAPLIPAACVQARRRAVRRSYRLFTVSLAESLRMDRLPARVLGPRHLRLRDPWGVFASRPLRGPAVLTTVHANWELMLAAVHRLGLVDQVTTIARDEGDPAIDSLRARVRAAVGCRSLTHDRAPLAVLRALRDGAVVGLVADRDYAGTGRAVAVARGRLRLPVGPAALAAQTGAPLVPLFLARRSWRSFDLFVGRPLRADPAADPALETRRLLDEHGRALARFLLAAPAQWVAFHPVWER
jgi:phosphatidylinositol dimannoside acyltransferase